jgi:murein DD-endopeptidase MepM/ murein hydrolase activator NlpD
MQILRIPASCLNFPAGMSFNTPRFSEWMHQLRLWLLLLISLIALVGIGCEGTSVDHLTVYAQDAVADPIPSQREEAGDPVPPIDSALLAKLKPCDGFDFPVGPPDAKHYFKARGFLPRGLEHLGEDWNGNRGGNSDFGDYVYATAGGVVFFTAHDRGGWGTVVRILHNYGTRHAPRFIESLYAHLSSSWVKVGNMVKRGDVIGTIGNAEGKYHAHLHLEMRMKPGKDLQCGYNGDTLGFVDPTAFISAHREVNNENRR